MGTSNMGACTSSDKLEKDVTALQEKVTKIETARLMETERRKQEVGFGDFQKKYEAELKVREAAEAKAKAAEAAAAAAKGGQKAAEADTKKLADEKAHKEKVAADVETAAKILFKSMDVDSDGNLAKEEVEAFATAHDKDQEKMFDTIMTDSEKTMKDSFRIEFLKKLRTERADDKMSESNFVEKCQAACLMAHTKK